MPATLAPIVGVSPKHDGSTDAPCQACGKPHLLIGANITQTLNAWGFTDAEIRAIHGESEDHYASPNLAPPDLAAKRARVRERVKRHRLRKASAT